MAMIPINLEYYRKKRPSYLAPIPDRDLIAAVIVRTALRRKQWPDAFGKHVAWCNEADAPLGACLEKISNEDSWPMLADARVHDGEKPFPPLQALTAWVPDWSERRLDFETLATWSRALPRLRSIGQMVIAEREAAKALKNSPAPVAKKADGDGDGGSGGKEAKPSAPPAEEEDEFYDDSILLTPEEAEELGIDLKPKGPGFP